MSLPPVPLSLSGFGVPSVPAGVEIRTLSGGERIRRALIPPAAGVAIAILVLPIPVVHFAVPPVALISGVVFGVRRLAQRKLFASASGICPFCGTEQTLGVNGAAYRLPRNLKCHSCLRPMTLDVA